jgi:hypothetical protein
MSTPIIALYAGGPLGPSEIAQNLAATQAAGWNTIILSLFHIGNPQNQGQSWGDIIFNGSPMVVSQGQYVADASWPANVAALKQTGAITKVYASIGGGQPVVDFGTLQTIYEQNGNSFSGTMLEANFQVFRKTFPAIDGIDMDVEDTYDQPSFVAFCQMLIGMGFDITFCPYTQPSFWTGSLAALQQSNPGAVKWWNLQCYAGGAGNDPGTWADAITQAIPGFATGGYIVASDWSRWYNTQYHYWDGDCPPAVTALLSGFAGEPSLGGGFIWNMDAILNDGPNPAGCGSAQTMADYAAAVAKAMPAAAPQAQAAVPA